MGMWDISILRLLWIVLLWAFVYKFLYGYLFFVPLGYRLRSLTSGSCGNSVFNLLRKRQIVFQNSYSTLHSHQQRVPFLTSQHPCLQVVVCLHCGQPGGWAGVSHGGFDWHFPNDGWHWASFHAATSHWYVFSGEMSFHILCSFFNWVICLFVFEF